MPRAHGCARVALAIAGLLLRVLRSQHLNILVRQEG
jgi:hypothetical protein